MPSKSLLKYDLKALWLHDDKMIPSDTVIVQTRIKRKKFVELKKRCVELGITVKTALQDALSDWLEKEYKVIEGKP